MAGAPAASAATFDKDRPKPFTTIAARRAAAASRAAAAAAAENTQSTTLVEPPLRMELQHASRFLPPGTVPEIKRRLFEAFSRILPAFDAAIANSESEVGLKGAKMWSLLGIDTDFRLDNAQAGSLHPLVLEANVSGFGWPNRLLFHF